MLDANGQPVSVEPIAEATPRDSYDERIRNAPPAVHMLGGGRVDEDDDCCGCDDSIALRAELETVRAERDYLLAFHDASEILQMHKHLAAEFESRMGWPAEPEDLGPIR